MLDRPILIAKLPCAGGGQCPRIYYTRDGSIYIQGYRLSSDEEKQLEEIRLWEMGTIRVPLELFRARCEPQSPTPWRMDIPPLWPEGWEKHSWKV